MDRGCERCNAYMAPQGCRSSPTQEPTVARPPNGCRNRSGGGSFGNGVVVNVVIVIVVVTFATKTKRAANPTQQCSGSRSVDPAEYLDRQCHRIHAFIRSVQRICGGCVRRHGVSAKDTLHRKVRHRFAHGRGLGIGADSLFCRLCRKIGVHLHGGARGTRTRRGVPARTPCTNTASGKAAPEQATETAAIEIATTKH